MEQTSFKSPELIDIEHRRKHVYEDALGPITTWGLALSGGGIRSATFCLGVLQALSKANFKLKSEEGDSTAPSKKQPLLARFDWLSTVSGGGYVGSFFSALFRTRAKTGAATTPTSGTQIAAADQAFAALAVDPPGRIDRQSTPNTHNLEKPLADMPLRWLRENGRYLAPHNSGDLLTDLAIAIRNLCAIHYVIGATLLTLFVILFEFRYASLHLDVLRQVAQKIELTLQPNFQAIGSHNAIWLSPWFSVGFVWLILCILPCGVMYWLKTESNDSKVAPKWYALTPSLAGCLVLLLGVATYGYLYTTKAGLWDDFLPLILLTFNIVLLISLLLTWYVWNCQSTNNVSMFRSKATRWLTQSLKVGFVFLIIGLIESCGQTLYLWLMTTKPSALTIGGLLASITAFVAAVRQLAPYMAQSDERSWLSKIPLNALLTVIGLLFLFAVLVFWHTLATALVFMGQSPYIPNMSAPMLMTQSATPIQYIVMISFGAISTIAAGYFIGFINLSSLQKMYSARLTRAYLGCANPERGQHADTSSVTKPVPGDDFSRAAFYAPQSHLGPVHIINVTINATTGSSDQLTQRDRKGLALALSPNGFSVNGQAHPADDGYTEELTIGQWIGLSGAAFSTGIGRGTNLGLALICSLLNVRLGWWWQAKPQPTGVGAWLGQLLSNQNYLSREMQAKFTGIEQSRWYLSDGGHYENTAVLELLRRKTSFIVCCDCGADPNYQFEDIANLMRLARIDLGAEFAVIEPSETEFFKADAARLKPYMIEPRLPLGSLKNTSMEDQRCAMLYRVTYPDASEAQTILLILKPRLIGMATLDVHEYQTRNRSFPQQSTADQFFDEAQWESYRKLGLLIGSRIFPCN